MRKERTLLFMGVWVIFLAYSGFPETWRKVLFILSGLFISYLAYLFHAEAKSRVDKDGNRIKSFIDNIKSGE